MMKMTRKPNIRRQNSATESWAFATILRSPQQYSGAREFPYLTLCVGIINQIERDWMSAANAYDYSGIKRLEYEISYPDGVVVNILEACNSSPERYIEKLRKDYPMGCEIPDKRRSKKMYGDL